MSFHSIVLDHFNFLVFYLFIYLFVVVVDALGGEVPGRSEDRAGHDSEENHL